MELSKQRKFHFGAVQRGIHLRQPGRFQREGRGPAQRWLPGSGHLTQSLATFPPSSSTASRTGVSWTGDGATIEVSSIAAVVCDVDPGGAVDGRNSLTGCL